MITIYVKNKALFLTQNLQDVAEEVGTLFITFESKETLLLAIEALEFNSAIHKMYVFYASEKDLWNIFQSLHTTIEAAGGVVINDKKDLLLIFRNNKWDLPKGKIEAEENKQTAALREVSEECGIASVKILKELPSTFHTYKLGTERILKQTYWYEMHSNDTKFTPQHSEGITEVAWANKEQLKEKLTNTYLSVSELIANHYLSKN